MKYLNGHYYVEVKDNRYRIHPTEKIILRKRDSPTAFRTQYQVQNGTEIRKNQKFFQNNGRIEDKSCPKNKQQIQQAKFKPPNCPNSKQNSWLEFDKGYHCKNCDYIINKQKLQIDKKVLRQIRDFCPRLNHDNRKIREIWMIIVNATYHSTEDMISKLQQLKGKTKLKFYKNISNSHDNVNIGMDEDPFARKAQGNRKTHHEVLLLMKFL